ncbi:hypothetical protein Efla_001705 [Eimeria flavescens]
MSIPSSTQCPVLLLALHFSTVTLFQRLPFASRRETRLCECRAATMNLGATIFGAHFGAYSFKNYLPVIAAVIVAAVVGEIAHNARVKKQSRAQAERISRMRQLVRKQRMKRDMALLVAQQQEVEAMKRRAAAQRLLYRPEAIDRRYWQRNKGRNVFDVFVEDDESSEEEVYVVTKFPASHNSPPRLARTRKYGAHVQKSPRIAGWRRRQAASQQAKKSAPFYADEDEDGDDSYSEVDRMHVSEDTVDRFEGPVQEVKAPAKNAEGQERRADDQAKTAGRQMTRAEQPVKKAAKPAKQTQKSVQKAETTVGKSSQLLEIAREPVKKGQQMLKRNQQHVNRAQQPAKTAEESSKIASKPLQKVEELLSKAEDSVD